jgi:hypothetical protein
MVCIVRIPCVTFAAISIFSPTQENHVKSLLIMLLIGICAIGIRSPEIMQVIGMASSAQDPSISVGSMTAPNQAMQQPKQKPMTAQEFAALSKTDPNAYQKFINSYQATEPERGEVDKLMNFLARGKFE